jgi:hypothetical protein
LELFLEPLVGLVVVFVDDLAALREANGDDPGHTARAVQGLSAWRWGLVDDERQVGLLLVL